MSGQEQFLAHLAELLTHSAIPFMLTGSIASSFYGNPRATNDIDIIIDPSAQSLEMFLQSLPNQWYVDAQAARDAMNQRSMFNVIDPDNGLKADLVIRKDRPFSRVEFARKSSAQVMGIRLPLVTPEDSILSKLEWSRDSASSRQYADALAIAVLSKSLDHAYLEQWAKELSLDQQLHRLLREAKAQRDFEPNAPKGPHP